MGYQQSLIFFHLLFPSTEHILLERLERITLLTSKAALGPENVLQVFVEYLNFVK